MDKERLELGAEEEIFSYTGHIEPLDAHAVTRKNDALLGFSPQCNRKHASQAGKAIFVPLHKCAKNGFRVGVGLKPVSQVFQFGTQLEVIVNLAVESDSEIAIFGQDRLVSGVQINNFQARRTHRKKIRLKDA